MQQVLDTGVFTQRNKQTINDNFTQLTNPDYWVRPQGPNANNNNVGTYESPFADLSGVTRYLTPGIVIGLDGVLFQNWAPPAVNDITIVGMGNTPRQATDSGIPNGGGATWLNVTHTTSATATSLLKIGGSATETKVSQAWRLVNIFMNNSSTNATTGCVELQRGDGSGVDVGRDASHFSMSGCILTGGNYGLLDQGGCSFVVIDNCVFFNFTGSGDTGIKEGTATDVALPLQWKITNSRFLNNANHIVMPFSSADIHDNTFGWLGSTTQTVKIYDATGGKNNTIWRNKIQAASDAANITAAVTLGTTDSYGPQYYTDKEEYATPSS
jgi:hypothetical protein